MLNIEAGTKDLLKEYYGYLPKQTMKTVVVMGGRPLAVAGLYVNNAKMVLFADISDELRENKSFKRIIIRCYRALLKNINLPVYSQACPDIEGSDRLLKHMGFSQYDGDIWVN